LNIAAIVGLGPPPPVVLGRSVEASSVTVTRAEALSVPPAPVAVALYVVDVDGLTTREPELGTVPSSLIETVAALFEVHLSVVLWPRVIAS
jgi:hypothetical protein